MYINVSAPRKQGARVSLIASAASAFLLGAALVGLSVWWNFAKLRVMWERVRPMGTSDFHPSPVDPATGYLVAARPRCASWWRSDYLPFEECSSAMLMSAVSTESADSTETRGFRTARRPGQVSGTTAATEARKEERRLLQAEGRGRSGSVGKTHWQSISRRRTGRELSSDSGRTQQGRQARYRPASRALSASSDGEEEVTSQPAVEWITHVTACNAGANRLAKAVVATGIQLSVLGLGTIWKSRWGYRMRLLHDHLVTLDDDKLVIVTDASDVIPVPETTPELVREKYDRLVSMYRGPRIFFAAEKICYPRPQLWRNFTDPVTVPGGKGGSPFRYLNAGIMVGPAGLLRQMLKLVYQQDCSDDQYLYTLAHLAPLLWWVDPVTGSTRVASSRLMASSEVPPEAQPLMGLDLWNELTMALYGVNRESFQVNAENGSLQFNPTTSRPLILHQNGNKHEGNVLEELAAEFGYQYDANFVKTPPKGNGPVNEAWP